MAKDEEATSPRLAALPNRIRASPERFKSRQEVAYRRSGAGPKYVAAQRFDDSFCSDYTPTTSNKKGDGRTKKRDKRG